MWYLLQAVSSAVFTVLISRSPGMCHIDSNRQMKMGTFEVSLFILLESIPRILPRISSVLRNNLFLIAALPAPPHEQELSFLPYMEVLWVECRLSPKVRSIKSSRANGKWGFFALPTCPAVEGRWYTVNLYCLAQKAFEIFIVALPRRLHTFFQADG